MAAASLPELEELIRTTGFFRNKAKSMQGAGRVITEEFHGKVPHTMPELLRIPGVARKTANVVLGSWFKHRRRHRRGHARPAHRPPPALTRETTPEKVERDLMRIIPQSQWIDFTHRIISHGRAVCIARKPRCADCPLEPLCNAPDKTFSSH